jgi:acyl carrier protein
MEQATIASELIKFLENNIVSEEIQVSPDQVLYDIGIDSYSIVEMVLFIERRFGVVVPDHLLLPENFKTVNALSEVVIKLL